jgi:hypothetical protein
VESVGVRLSQITDGLSNTILAGEKHVPKGYFGVGWYDNCTYNGDWPQCYTRGASPQNTLEFGNDGVGIALDPKDLSWKWGSAHTAVCQFVLCDGSVQGIFKSISPETLYRLCVRDDGLVVGDY